MTAAPGMYAFAGGLITLIGWVANIPPLTDWAHSGISMMPNMAVALMLAGAALALFSFGHPRAAAVLGLLTGLIGAATLFEHITQINLGIDTLLVSRPWGQRGTLAMGRIGPPGSASLAIIGAAIVLAAWGRKSRGLAAAGGILVIGIATLSITGYIFGADALFSLPRLTVIALQTATMLLALGIGLVMSVPEAQPMKMLRDDSAAAALVRRALPFIILLPLVVGWLRLHGQNAGWYDAAFGTALRTVVEVALLVGLLWWAATAVKSHEKPLRESETRKAAILKSSLDAIVSMDGSGLIVEFNPAAEMMFGRRAAEVIGRPLSQVIIPERLRPAHEQGLAHYRATGEGRVLGRRIEMPALRADGTEFPVELSINRVPGIEPPLFSGFIRDISERKLAVEQRSMFAAIIESSDDAILSKDLNGIITSWNPGAERLFGYTAAEAVGQPVLMLVPRDRFNEEPAILERIRRGERVDHYETIRRRKDGTLLDVSLTISPIVDSEGKIIGASKIARNISERAQADETRSRLAAIVESSDDAILSKNLNGIITSWNAGAQRIFGYTAEETVGQPVTMLMPPERFNEEPGILERIRRGDRVDHYETIRRRKDGTLFDVSLTISPIADSQGKIIGASKIARDITEHKRAQQALREAHELLESRASQLEKMIEERTAELRKSNEELVASLARQDKLTADLRETVQQLETFSYSIVHDMRAPLRSMRSFASFLESEYRDKLDATGRSYLQRIMGSAIRMDALITDVLTYSRITSGETPLTPVNLDELVTEIVENYPQFQESAAAIHIKHPLPPVCGNPALLTQIISNLLGNALKFIPPDRAARVTVRGENGAGKVRLWFEDNGIGIAPEHQEQIFHLFRRLHRPDEYPGTGVGLAIVRKAAARMGGKVGLESEPGAGSRFWVELDSPGGDAQDADLERR
jgi:PAS domain S-box-containing protein